MPDCFLEGHGPCSDRISREHYISASVLRAISGETGIRVGGLAWQPSDLMQSIGIPSLQSKILCTRHNSELSPLDSAAATLFESIIAIDKGGPSLRSVVEIEGPIIERWLLKALCGSSFGGALKFGAISEQLKGLLLGDTWPNGWGLYARPSPGGEIFSRDLFIETKVHPITNEVLAVLYRVAGVTFNLLLGSPDNPDFFGLHHPKALIFRRPGQENRIEFTWPHESTKALYFTHLGTTEAAAPHTKWWREQ